MALITVYQKILERRIYVVTRNEQTKQKDLIIKKNKEEKSPTGNYAATYIPTPEGCSIISDERLSFQVRNGAGRFPLSIAT